MNVNIIHTFTLHTRANLLLSAFFFLESPANLYASWQLAYIFYKCGLEVLTCLCPLIGVFNINYSLTIEPSLTGSPHIVLCIAAHLPLKHVAHIPSAAMKISNQRAAGPWHTAVIEQALLIHFSKRNLNLTMDSCLNVKLHLCESDKLDILVFFSETTPCVRLM